MRSTVWSSTLLSVALGLAACGGHASIPGEGEDAGPDGGYTGLACAFDTDCAPPDYICDSVTNTCEQGCTLNPTCPPGKVCNASTGRCIVGGSPDAGHVDGGATDGGGADGGAGVPSDTLCKACATNSDCHAGGLCVSNATHTGNFCTQDCTTDLCPTGYQCTLDRTGTKHQCYPDNGQCSSAAGTPDGGTGGGNDGGPVNDPNQPSDNPNGCGMCGQCGSNNDCVTGSVCANGACAIGCDNFGWADCAIGGALASKCQDLGNGHKYCLPFIGQCLPLPAPISGDPGCVPTGANPACASPSIPAAALGANVSVTAGLSPKPLLASEDSIVVDGQGRMALGYIGVDSSGASYMGVSQSLDNGVTWVNRGKMKATTGVQSDPVLVNSKWTDSAGTHERMHYVWVGYTLVQVNGQAQPKDMFMESSYSDDGGATWAPGQKATTVTDNNNGVLLLDKPWIAVSPDASQTLMLNFSIGDNNQQHMYVVTSIDHGNSWRPSVAIETGDNNHGHNLGMPVFDPSDATGNTAYITYVNYTQIEAGTSNSILLVKTVDKGKTWTGPYLVSDATDQVLFEPPSIAMDKSHHVFVGYVSAANGAPAKYWDGMVATVDASAATPVVAHRAKVSDDQGGCFQHIHVMTAVDQATGKLFAGWLDNRMSGAKGGTWYSVSSDQGTSFGASKLVSDQPYKFNPDHSTAQLNFLGDYFGFIFDGSKLRIAWSDPRNNSESQVFYAGGTP